VRAVAVCSSCSGSVFLLHLQCVSLLRCVVLLYSGCSDVVQYVIEFYHSVFAPSCAVVCYSVQCVLVWCSVLQCVVVWLPFLVL